MLGKHLSNDQLADLVGSGQGAIDSVTSWLEANNAKSVRVSVTKDYIWVCLLYVSW